MERKVPIHTTVNVFVDTLQTFHVHSARVTTLEAYNIAIETFRILVHFPN